MAANTVFEVYTLENILRGVITYLERLFCEITQRNHFKQNFVDSLTPQHEFVTRFKIGQFSRKFKRKSTFSDVNCKS